MIFETLFFDLDDTLYPSTCGLWGELQKRIELFMVEQMGFEPQIVPSLRQELFQTYGTTLRGLEIKYHVSAQDYLAFVHDVPLANFIQADPELKSALESLPQRKVIFTNADSAHANRVLQILGLEGCFDQIIDILAIHPYCKPQAAAFAKALALAEIKNPQDCVMIDDANRNLLAAREAGLFTIKVGVNDCPDGIDASVISILDLPSVIPGF